MCAVGPKPPAVSSVMSQDIVHTCLGTSLHLTCLPWADSHGSGPTSAPQQLAVFGQHTDPQTVDEHDHPGADEPASEPDVMQA